MAALEDPRGLVVVWDASESASLNAGRINLGEYLNPVTWSLSAKRRCRESQILVLECPPGMGRELRFTRIVQALHPSSVPFRVVPAGPRYLVECLKAPPPDATLAGSNIGLELLVNQLRSMLSRRGSAGDHHALANMVGPLILLSADPDGAPEHSAQLLLSLLREVDILPTVPAPRPATLVPADPGAIDEPPVRLLIVDDQWSYGWDRWVAGQARRHGAYSVVTADSPHFLVDAVEAAAPAASPSADCRFRLSFGASSEATVLLLDLRMFSLRPLSEEVAFVRDRLLPACERFVRRRPSNSDLAWPSFTRRELSAAQRWCITPSRVTDSYLEVLTLLPRLLALADCSLPIVLFSSTGQRRIVETLKPYGNIITDFAKPSFSGPDVLDVVAETESRFSAALSKARDILRARQHCRHILLPSTEPPLAVTLPSARYIEVYLDEQDWGAGHFTVGGCFAVYEAASARDARGKADRFDAWLVRQGVRYFDSRGVGAAPDDGTLREKGSDLTPYLRSYRGQPDAPLHLGLIRLRIPRDGAGSGRGILFDSEEADNRYHLALKAILELFLCESVPAVADPLPPEEDTVSIFPATRVVYINKPSSQYLAMTRFGLQQTNNPNLFFSLTRSQVYPVVADILDARGITRKTDRLVAVQLPYNKGHLQAAEYYRCRQCGKLVRIERVADADAVRELTRCSCDTPDWQPDYRALHYLADELLSEFSDGQQARRYDEIFRSAEPLPGEFDELMDEHLVATLRAGRALDLSDAVGAVAEFEPPLDTPGKPRASVWLQRRLQSCLRSMSGDEFLRVAEALRPVRR
jgi:hypothetical protein